MTEIQAQSIIDLLTQQLTQMQTQQAAIDAMAGDLKLCSGILFIALIVTAFLIVMAFFWWFFNLFTK